MKRDVDLLVLSSRTRTRLADALEIAFKPRAISAEVWDGLKSGTCRVLGRSDARTLVWLHPRTATIIFGLTARDFGFPDEVEVDEGLPGWLSEFVSRVARIAARAVLTPFVEAPKEVNPNLR